MRRLLVLVPVLVLVLGCAGRAAAWDSRCYLPGGIECFFGPASARGRWIGPSDEHRALLELGRIFGGLPSSTSNAFTLPVFTSDDQLSVIFSAGFLPPPFDIGPAPPLPATSLQPVSFIDTKRAQSRTMSFPEFAQLPDLAYSLWDWALGNETCPLDHGAVHTDATACHEFKSHMGPVNSNHFPPQSAFFYEYYHRLALDRAHDCKEMTTRLGNARARFAEFPVACEQEALVLEAIGQHFLQDAWASGHMWERWGSPDVTDFPSLTRALIVAMSSGIIHGARAVLEDLPTEVVAALGTTRYHFDDPLNAPDPRVAFRGPSDLFPQPGAGDLYLTDLIAQDGIGFPAEFDRLFSCEAAGLRAVYLAAGEAEGALGPLRAGLADVDPTSDASCFGQRATNAAMQKGIGLDFSTPNGRPVRVELDSSAATHLVPILSTQAGGQPTLADLTQYQVDIAHIVSIARITARQDPNGVTLASGGLPPLLGIEANGFYVKSPLAAYVDPPLPWPASGGTGEAVDRANALARTFHRAHAIDWCNAFHDGDAQQLDVTAFADKIAALQDEGGPELDALCAMCEEFAPRHLRVGTDAGDYDQAREPLCHFIADDAASVQYVYQSGTESDSIPALAARFCGCAPPAPTCQASAAVNVHDHFERFTAGAGEIFFDTTVAFTYTGGTVLLAEDEDGGGAAFVDDEIIVTVTHPDQTSATFDHDYSNGCAGVITHTNSDVTSLFEPGVNQVRVQFKNTCGGNASADSLSLVPCD